MCCLDRRSRKGDDDPEELPAWAPEGEADYLMYEYSIVLSDRSKLSYLACR